jgi:hypothetical protein
VPPPQTDIRCEELDGGIIFHVPPIGLRRAGGGSLWGFGRFMALGLFTTGFAALITAAAVFGTIVSLIQGTEVQWGFNGILGLFLCWAVPAMVMIVGWYYGNTHTLLAARDGTLGILFAGPWRSRRLEYTRAEIRDIKQGIASEPETSEGYGPAIPVLQITTIKDLPRRFLIIQPDRYREHELLSGRSVEEIQWIAARLTETLELPPPKPMNFWQWLGRNSPQ